MIPIGFTIKEVVNMTIKWLQEHSRKTRQSELLKLYPNAGTNDDGILLICPRRLDINFEPPHGCYNTSCEYCTENYWLTEIE